MSKSTKRRKLVLPTSWSGGVRSALLHVVSLAQYAAVYTRSWAAESHNARVRLKADKDQLLQEVALLRALRSRSSRGQRLSGQTLLDVFGAASAATEPRLVCRSFQDTA